MSETRLWPIPEPSADGVFVRQISDTHIGYRPWSYAECDHMRYDCQHGLIPKIDISVYTGDITDGNTANIPDEDRYALRWLDDVTAGTPELVAMGNHDIRNRPIHTRAEWERIYRRSANRFVDVGGIRFVAFAVDSHNWDDWVVPAATWDWVNTVTLAATGPVVLVDHYPPSELGNLQQDSLLPAGALGTLVGDNPNVVGFLCGHMHKELNDPTVANFWTIGGRSIPVMCDVSSMLSLDGHSRDQSAQTQSHSAYIDMQEDQWRVFYRAHGTHGWSGPHGNRTTVLDLVHSTVTYRLGG